MEGEGEGGVSGHDKLCMCLILRVCVCVWEKGEGVASYFTRLDNFEQQRFLNKRGRGSKLQPKSINQCIISYADEGRIKTEKHIINVNSTRFYNHDFYDEIAALKNSG